MHNKTIYSISKLAYMSVATFDTVICEFLLLDKDEQYSGNKKQVLTIV